MTRIIRRLLCGAACSVLLSALSWRALALPVYTFENLNLGGLVGQDGWTLQGGADSQLVNGSGVDSTKIVRGFPVSADVRNNDASFSFATFTGTETAAILQFDAHA